MSTAAGKFNLRPQERRLVAVVALVLFVVLNIVFIWPHFDDWGAFELKQERAKKSLASYQAEIVKVPSFRVKLRELEQAGSSVVPEEQELDLVRTVNVQAQMNRLTVISSDPRPRVNTSGQTNRFFEEQYEMLHVTADNEELINFLMSLTSTNSLIRVKDLTVRPDAGGTRLDANMQLVASYQRTAPSRAQANSAAPAPTSTVAAPKPALARPTVKTNQPGLTIPSRTNRVGMPKPRLTNQPPKKP